MDLTALTAGVTAAKEMKKIFSDISQVAVEHQTQQQLNTAAKSVSELLDNLYAAQNEMFNLAEKNRELNDQLEASKTWGRTAENYSLVETSGGSLVYKFIGETGPNHFICPRCFELRLRQILQPVGDGAKCMECNSFFEIYPPRDLTYTSDYNPLDRY